MQSSPVGTRLFAVAGRFIVRCRWVTSQDIALWDKARDQGAVGSKEEYGVECYENRGENASNNALPGDADTWANACKEKIEGCDKR